VRGNHHFPHPPSTSTTYCSASLRFLRILPIAQHLSTDAIVIAFLNFTGTNALIPPVHQFDETGSLPLITARAPLTPRERCPPRLRCIVDLAVHRRRPFTRLAHRYRSFRPSRQDTILRLRDPHSHRHTYATFNSRWATAAARLSDVILVAIFRPSRSPRSDAQQYQSQIHNTTLTVQ
jgi:hypothetical protein